MTRPLPWHDTPKCKQAGCGGPVVMDADLGVSPMCGACGAMFKNATVDEAAQIQRAEEAWEKVLAGDVHEDKACALCGWLLPIEQSRLCPPCVAKDMAARTLPLFPDSEGEQHRAELELP